MIPADVFEVYDRAIVQNREMAETALAQAFGQLASIYPEGVPSYLARDYLAEVYAAICEEYGGRAAVVAREFVEQVAVAEGVSIGEGIGSSAGAGVLHDDARCSIPGWRGGWKGSLTPAQLVQLQSTLEGKLDYRLGRQADGTLEKSCGDRARYALVTHPGACQWCYMVAGHGFSYSKAGLAGQRHSHCKCTSVCSISGTAGIEGYDPDSAGRRYWELVDLGYDIAHASDADEKAVLQGEYDDLRNQPL